MRSPKTVRAVHANRGIEARYRAQLSKMIDEMHASVLYWTTAAYRRDPPRMEALAQDAAPSKRVNKIMEELAARWIAKFDEWAPKLADAYLSDAFKATDNAFRQALKDAGWSVKFTITPAVRDAFEASLAENVGLIKSIPEKYLQQVQGAVMRSYTTGRDLHGMVNELNKIYPANKARATLIARDQSNKANAVVNRARQLELGMVDAIWMHSHAGKTPRPDHLAADGKRYKIAEGCKISGEYIQPGEEINCRCTCRAVLPI